MAWMWPPARYSATIVGGGGVSTRSRCYNDDAIAAQLRVAQGPMCDARCGPENVKNEARIPLFIMFVCVTHWLLWNSMGWTSMDA